MIRKLGYNLLLLAAISAAPIVLRAQGAPDPSLLREIQKQAAIIKDNTPVNAAARDEAARRLVLNSNSDSKAALLAILKDFSNREAQLAVARAISVSTMADLDFQEPLIALMGSDRALTEAGAEALTLYKTPRAHDQLEFFATNLSLSRESRTAVVRAMGSMLNKQAAGVLIELLQKDDNQLVRDASAESLVEMTGLVQYGHDAQRWAQWWTINRDRPEVEWTLDLLNRRVARMGELERRHSRLSDRVNTLLQDEYKSKPEADRAGYVGKLLKDTSEDIRLAGVRIVYDEVSVGKILPPAVFENLRGLIGDSVPEVRVRVVRTLMAANDPGAFDSMLTQLAQEKDPDVIAALLKAFGPAHDLRAVDPLVSNLDNPSYTIAKAAADGLKDMASELVKPENKALSDKVDAALLARLPKTATDVAASQLRTSVVQALASLARPSDIQTFYDMIKPSEKLVNVRRAALDGLRRIASPQSADIIIQSLTDPDAGVRLDAVAALDTTASFEHAEALSRLLSETVEKDRDVRTKVWEVLLKLMDKGSVEALSVWTRKPLIENTPERKVLVLAILEKKLAAGGKPEQLALYRQNLGQTLLELKRPKEASEKLRQAYDYWKTSNATPAVREPSTMLLIEALLKDKNYTDATAFSKTILDETQGAGAQPIWSKILTELERLRAAKEWDNAIAMVEEMKKIPLGALYLKNLETWEKDLLAAKSTGGFLIHNPQYARLMAESTILL